MNCDADLEGPVSYAAPDVEGSADGAEEQIPLFGPAAVEFLVRSASLESSLDAEASSLIEDNWISDSSSRQCDHYLEHRLMAQEYEGLRMGRELHDSTAQLLLSLRLSVAHLKSAFDAGESEQILEEISETVRQIDQEIRAFSYLHYPAELGKGGLIAALKTLARGFADRTGLRIVFRALCDRPIANGASSVALLRVAQEALMNVHRHAHAELVRMSLVEHGDTVELSIQDDGQGMPPETSESVSKGLGLQGMRHRIERLGGHFSIKRLRHGTKIAARLTINRKRPRQTGANGPKSGYPYQAQ